MNKEKTPVKSTLIVIIVLAAIILIYRINKQSNRQLQNDVQPINNKNIPAKNTENVYEVIEQMPQFPGGEQALLKYLSTNIKYPIIAQENGVQGKVIVRFVVNKSGEVENAVVLKAVDESLDAEALRVVNSLPDWIPGEQKGEKVSVYYTLPISFKLQ
jgi:protein TonB